jgi:hypothetical protein
VLTRLRLAFAAHPWVGSVQSVQIVPPRQLRVLLQYRTPALAIPQVDYPAIAAWIPARLDAGKLPGRVVDRNGVLLPLAAKDPQLPVLYGKVSPPTGQPGQPWGDANIAAVAAVASLLEPYQEQLKLKDFEITEGVLVLRNQRTRVVWGSLTAEPPPEQRIQTLLELRTKYQTLDDRDIDLSH